MNKFKKVLNNKNDFIINYMKILDKKSKKISKYDIHRFLIISCITAFSLYLNK
jgi:hypothetical protein